MTIDQETVIRLAKEARGLLAMDESLITMIPDELERFAALVLEHGRKPLTVRKAKDIDGNCDVVLAADLRAAHGIPNKESSDADN